VGLAAGYNSILKSGVCATIRPLRRFNQRQRVELNLYRKPIPQNRPGFGALWKGLRAGTSASQIVK
jgi:hypothetical protein